MNKEVLQPKSAAATLRRGLSLLVALAMILTWAPPVYATEPVPQGQQVEIATGESALEMAGESEPETAEENLPETEEENLPEAAEENPPEAAEENLPETIEGNAPEIDADTPETAEQSGNRLDAVQALLDALPDADTVNAQTAEQVKAQLAAIDAAKLELTDEELDALDIARYRAVVAALHALENQPGAGNPQPLAETVVGAFTVEGDPAGYSYANGVLTITNDAALTIRNTDPAATTDRIFVDSGVSANITLAGVNIDARTTGDAAFKIADNSTGNVTVTLVGDNILQSGENRAGMMTNGEDGTLTITGTGTLNATGGMNGAGIGGGNGGSGSNITISGGTVNATGGFFAAGIGGGNGDSGSNITISGGTVNATGLYGAGIGGGNVGSGTVTITGGTVTATGEDRGAGIGNGNGYTGSGGSFSTTATDGTKGNAWIEASSISDNDDTTAWSGIIFQGNEGQVYGNPTLTTNAEIKAGKTLTVPNGKTLTIANGVTLTNNGTIIQNGTINGSVGGTIIQRALTVTGGVEGTDYTYEYGMLIVRKETPLTISGTSTTERIVVAGNVNANITLENANIDMSNNWGMAAFEIERGTGNVTVTLKGENTLKSGTNCAGMMINGEDGTLTIQGDGSLTAIGGNDGAGIGGYGGQGCNITIAGGNVTAIGGENAAGIGGTLSTGTDGNAWIVASSISDKSHSDNWSGVIFEGNVGQVYGNPTLTTNATIKEGETLTVPSGTTLTIANGVTLTIDGTITNNGTIIQNGTINGSVGGTIIQRGLTVTGGEEGTAYSYENGVLTVLSDANLTISMKEGVTPPTTDRIEVAKDVSANITLAGVNIDVSDKNSTAAFQIADNSTGNVTITLADGTTNTLRSGLSCAGLQKNGNDSSGTLTIQGEGTLTAIGGDYGAGIGGVILGSGSNITISGGTVTATGKGGGAGIGGGGGGNGDGSNITITGGTVTATGGGTGAGIGGGEMGSGTVTITGGTVTATGGYGGAGIGGGGGGNGDGSNITITGGTVTATGGYGGAGIGNGKGYTGSGGSFSTTATTEGGETVPGNAFIDASSISDNDDTTAWSGIIFQGNEGQVYGDPTLRTDATIKDGETLTVPNGTTLTIANGVTLTNNGTLTVQWGGHIAGDGTLTGSDTAIFQTENLTADDIVLPANLVYNGNNRTEEIKTALANLTTTICGQPFQITGWTLSVTKVNDLKYTVVYTRDGTTERITTTVTLGQSGTQFGDDGKAKTYKGGVEATEFTYGETITVKAKPTPTGTAPATMSLTSRLRGAPTVGQMALYYGDTQVSEAVGAVNGEYTMTVPVQTLIGKGAQYGQVVLTAKFVGTDTMADASSDVTVTLKKKALTITAKAQTITYGETIATGTDQVTTGTLVTGDTLESITLTASSNQVAATGKTITPSSAVIKNGGKDVTDNYAITYETGNLTINKAPLTIKGATLAAKTYDGTTDGTVESVEFNGLVNNESLTLGTDYTATAEFADANAGQGKTATVTVTLADNSNYAFAEGANTYILSDLTIQQSGTQFEGEDAVEVYNGDRATLEFTYGETITVKAKPTATGQAPVTMMALAGTLTPPTAGQMALYLGGADGTQVSEAVSEGEDGYYTMTVPVQTLIDAGAKYNEGVILTAKFVENDNMADAFPTVTVTLCKATITDIAATVADVKAPEAKAPVQKTVQSGSNYTAAIAWNPKADSVYDFNTKYTATLTLTLTPDGNHTFGDLTADGWTITKNPDGTVTLQKTFAATRKEKITAVTASTNQTLTGHKSTAEEVIATLPETVKATLESGGTDLTITWKVNGDYDKTPKATNTFTWAVTDTGAYDLTGVTLTGTITVTNPAPLTVTITGEDKTITYTGKTADLSELFTIDENAGAPTYRVTGGTGKGTLEGKTLTVTEAGTFTVTVDTAANGFYGTGTATATLTVNKGTGTGTVTLESWVYGDPAKTPVAKSATNGTDNVTYTYAPKARSAAVPQDVGEYTVTATFAETKLYNACTATADFAITARPVTVTITANGGTYNGKPFEATAILSGVVEGETVPVTLTYYKKGEADALPGAPTDVGEYTVAATITDSNYILKPTEKDFTIQKAVLTVTVNDQTKTYGDPDPTLTYTLDGALAGDDELKLALAHSGEDIGTYDITDPNVGTNNPNYAVTVEKGTMTIEQRSIESAAVVLGEALTANGTEQTQTIQSVTVKNSAGEDLAVTYDVTGNTGTGAGQYTMTLTGTGNFTGRITQPFTIGAPAETPPEPTPGETPKPETKPGQAANQSDAAAQQNAAAAAQQSAAATATVPPTGDDSAIELWFLLFALSAVGLGALAIQKRKNNRS